MSWISEDQPEGQKLKIVLQNNLSECLKVIKVKCYQFFIYISTFRSKTIMEMKVETAVKV